MMSYLSRIFGPFLSTMKYICVIDLRWNHSKKKFQVTYLYRAKILRVICIILAMYSTIGYHRKLWKLKFMVIISEGLYLLFIWVSLACWIQILWTKKFLIATLNQLNAIVTKFSKLFFFNIHKINQKLIQKSWKFLVISVGIPLMISVHKLIISTKLISGPWVADFCVYYYNMVVGSLLCAFFVLIFHIMAYQQCYFAKHFDVNWCQYWGNVTTLQILVMDEVMNFFEWIIIWQLVFVFGRYLGFIENGFQVSKVPMKDMLVANALRMFLVYDSCEGFEKRVGIIVITGRQLFCSS